MANFCFVFCVYQDEDNVKTLVQQLRTFFPESKIICITDGKTTNEFIFYLKIEQIKYVVGDRFKPQKNGGAWLKRILSTYLSQSDAPYLIKVEPDSLVFRSFASIPDTDIGGTIIQLKNRRELIHGGAVFFKREVVTKIVNSQILDNPKYKQDRRFGYQRYEPPYLQPGEVRSSEWIVSGDAVLADVIQELELTVEDWTDVSCGVYPLSMASDKWAMFHPAKTSINITPTVNAPDWESLLNRLRGSAYFNKIFSAATEDLNVNTKYTTLLAAFSFRSMSDLKFSLASVKESMGDILSSQDISEINAILSEYNFPISL